MRASIQRPTSRWCWLQISAIQSSPREPRRTTLTPRSAPCVPALHCATQHSTVQHGTAQHGESSPPSSTGLSFPNGALKCSRLILYGDASASPRAAAHSRADAPPLLYTWVPSAGGVAAQMSPQAPPVTSFRSQADTVGAHRTGRPWREVAGSTHSGAVLPRSPCSRASLLLHKLGRGATTPVGTRAPKNQAPPSLLAHSTCLAPLLFARVRFTNSISVLSMLNCCRVGPPRLAERDRSAASSGPPG